MLIRNATLVDANHVMQGDLLIENGVITTIGLCLPPKEGHTEIDAQGKILMPAFIDLHAHFRTPGFEYKEDLQTASKAAARGGYTNAVCMANTNPPCSSSEIAHAVMEQAKEIGLCDVHQCVSITQNFDGQTLTHLKGLADDIRIISDDGRGVQSSYVMFEAMKIAKEKNLLVMSHAEDMDLSKTDYRLAENLETARNLYLAMATGAKLHMSHVSTKEALQDIVTAKKRGVAVTCEVTPHHIWFYDFDYRVNPPIRQKEDVAYIVECMKQGFVDAIATDHAPHTQQEKEKGAPGMIGLETSFGVCYTKLCKEQGLSLSQLSRMMSQRPAEILGLNQGLLQVGMSADLVLVDCEAPYQVDVESFASKSKNSPFHGVTLWGQVCLTVKQGNITYQKQ